VKQTKSEITSSILTALAMQFDSHRKSHKPVKRIPDSLRNAAVAALEEGLPVSRICNACRIAHSQLKAWQISAQKGNDIKILPVLDNHSCLDKKNSDGSAPLTLSLGNWRISIEMADTIEPS